MTKDPSLLDKTDQYIFFSAGTMSFESGVKGYTDGQFSFVNLKQLSFGGDAMYRSENGPEMGLIANTAAHESMHGYLTRAIGYLNTNNEAMGLDIEGHSVSGQNLMTGADRKNRSRSFINSRNISPTDRLTPNHQTAVSTYIKEHLSSFRTPPDYLNILLPRNYKY